MQNYAQNLSDEDFAVGVDQNFTTVLSCGTEVPLFEGAESVQLTKDRVNEFIELVLEARKKEASLQVDAIRKGFLKVLKDSSEIFDYLDSATLDVRCTGEKVVSVERLKSITTFPNNNADHEIIDRFWRVFESFNNQERQSYLKFVWGRSRLPANLDNLDR